MGARLPGETPEVVVLAGDAGVAAVADAHVTVGVLHGPQPLATPHARLATPRLTAAYHGVMWALEALRRVHVDVVVLGARQTAASQRMMTSHSSTVRTRPVGQYFTLVYIT